MPDAWLAEEIREYLRRNRYSQTWLSKATKIELCKLNLSLNGKRRFTFTEYALICGALKVNTDKFLKPRLPEGKGE